MPTRLFGVSRPYSGTPREIAQSFLDEHPVLFGLDRVDSSVVFTRERTRSQVQRVEWQRRYKGVDVFHSTIAVLVDGDRVTTVIAETFQAELEDVSPDFPPDAAGERIRAAVDGAPIEAIGKPNLVILKEGRGKLAYTGRVIVGTDRAPHDVALDAETGSVLWVRNLEVKD